jgi:hypothetical protein
MRFRRRSGGERFLGRAAGSGLRAGRFRLRVVALQDRVLHQQALDLLIELDRRQLQQLDRLLQLGRERQVL